MSDMRDAKTALHHYLRQEREALIWKLDGLSEREARLPRTASGNNLLGVLKHCVNVEAGYFGSTFGRSFPSPGDLVSDDAFDDDPQADWYATADETTHGLIDLARRVWAFADETIEGLPLDALGRVPWWPIERQEVTLERIMVHVLSDLARHAGQADIMREELDGAIGLQPGNTNVADGYDWPAYVERLRTLAETF